MSLTKEEVAVLHPAVQSRRKHAREHARRVAGRSRLFALDIADD